MARWQPRQAFAQAVTSVERPFHTYLEEMRRRVARVFRDEGEMAKAVGSQEEVLQLFVRVADGGGVPRQQADERGQQER